VTREKLIVDEDVAEEEPAFPAKENIQIELTEQEYDEEALDGLSDSERRLLRCLLYGQSIGWVREEGLLLSVLVDGINEKLFDRFSDTVLFFDTQLEPVEEYLDDLRELIAP
jgi:hypothetical protein